MYWYNPKTGSAERVPTPVTDAEAAREWRLAEDEIGGLAEYAMNSGVYRGSTVALLWDAAQRAEELGRRAKARLEAEKVEEAALA
jgi:hypothetical protein